MDTLLIIVIGIAVSIFQASKNSKAAKKKSEARKAQSTTKPAGSQPKKKPAPMWEELRNTTKKKSPAQKKVAAKKTAAKPAVQKTPIPEQASQRLEHERLKPHNQPVHTHLEKKKTTLQVQLEERKKETIQTNAAAIPVHIHTDAETLVQGLVWGEILGKPKAYQRKNGSL